MIRFRHLILGIAVLVMAIPAFSQTGGEINNPDEPYDGTYIKMHYPNRRVVPYSFLREADAMWAKRIWREIDLREKMNQNYYYPLTENNQRKNLIKVILDGILTENKINAYSSDDDEFRIKLTTAEVLKGVESVDSLTMTREVPPYEEFDTVIARPFDPTTVKKFKLKEDWVFDRQRSVMEPRIIGIAPVQARIDENSGELRGYLTMFWVYFPQARKVFTNYEVYNRYNFTQRVTFDDVFMKRMFSSRIIKVDNEHDRNIEEYVKGINALLEAEEIKSLIFTFEHDVWEQ